ncbi:hypothetical protein [Poseidonocella sp. HB161398]|uniref:hypothetical protein n=1 Tax=Poseidonocella sp. HB161398 TaxID=2320855 RepID=UPI0014868BE3|nr:hypothetical protein [Poseidonocella sp. HB161398]
MDRIESDGFKKSLLGLALAEHLAWAVGVLPVLAVLLAEILCSLMRGAVGLDIVAPCR